MTLSNHSATAESSARFWVICFEETAATQQLSNTIANWEIPGVRSLVGTDELAQSDIKQADYAIFATESDRPCSQVQVSPLNRSQVPHISQLLSSMQSSQGRMPQSWLMKLPTAEVRANKLQPVETQYAVGQALSKIEVFVRNYHLQPQARQAMLQKPQ